jgi:hypothetical protein
VEIAGILLPGLLGSLLLLLLAGLLGLLRPVLCPLGCLTRQLLHAIVGRNNRLQIDGTEDSWIGQDTFRHPVEVFLETCGYSRYE